MTRGEANRRLASELGASFVGGATDAPPVRLDSAVVFAPAGELVPVALNATERGGTVALAGIYMSDVPSMPYERLFLERDLRTVTSNTRADGEALFRLAAQIRIDVQTSTYGFDEADRGLADLKSGAFAGSGVVVLA
jgi:alcohol dehydrogenase, propanol-preferring